jgi:RNA polymerase sigma factor (sigma-70 family)
LEAELCTGDQDGQSDPGNGGEHCEDDGERRLRAAFDRWIRRSAKSALSNLLRDRNTKKRHPGRAIQSFDEMFPNYQQPDETPGVSSIVVRDEDAERLREAMACCLDDRTREIVLRYIVEGHTFGEIAVDLCLSYEQVRYAFHKAQAELTQWINSNQNHD